MPPPKLYDEGWKQGSLIRAPLEVHFLDIEDDAVVDRVGTFGLWLLATQDCDLAQTPSTNTTRQFELRPVVQRSDDDKLDGLRSRSVLVREGFVLRAESPKLTLTARALNTFKNRREDDLSAERRVEIKLWLGLRYDRPAVPERFVPLASQLKAKFLEAQPDGFVGVMRDIWVYFENEAAVRLFFIIADAAGARRDEVLNWVDDVAGEMLDAGCVALLERQVETSHGTPLWVLQNYYGLDVWPCQRRSSKRGSAFTD
ncbi:MAG: hypothetical protein ACLPYS_19075 [Vulcanimicrobiaceae bacterium]